MVEREEARTPGPVTQQQQTQREQPSSTATQGTTPTARHQPTGQPLAIAQPPTNVHGYGALHVDGAIHIQQSIIISPPRGRPDRTPTPTRARACAHPQQPAAASGDEAPNPATTHASTKALPLQGGVAPLAPPYGGGEKRPRRALILVAARLAAPLVVDS